MSIKISFSVLTTGILLSILPGCSQKTEQADSTVSATIDSLASARIAEANMQAMDQLDSRISIEVPQKADSIVRAREASAAAGTPVAQ